MTNNSSTNNMNVKVRYREPYFIVGNMLLNIDNFIGKSFITEKSFEEKFLEDLPKETSLEITPEARNEIEKRIKKNIKL